MSQTLLQKRKEADRLTQRPGHRGGGKRVDRAQAGVPRYAVRRESDTAPRPAGEKREEAQEKEEEPASATLQAALIVGSADDPFEQEAEATARRVVDGGGVAPPSAGEEGAAAGLHRAITPLFARRSRALQRQQEGEGEQEEGPVFDVDSGAAESIVEEFRAEQEEAAADTTTAEPEGAQGEGESGPAGGEEGTVQARRDGPGGRAAHPAPSGFESALARRRGGGDPLDPATRDFMEPRFGADFSAVRIHRDSEADRLSRQIGARAFTHGTDIYFASGHYAPERDEGRRLLAHELTHVVQQGGAREQVPGVSRASGGVIRRGLLVWLAEKANALLRHIPGFTLLTVIVGYNPILGERVARTPRNLLEGVITLVPGGALLFDRLDKGGAIDEAAAWLGREIDRLGITLAKVKQLFSQAWDEMSIWKGIGGNIAVLRRVFGGLVGRIVRFVRNVALKLKELAFKAVLRLVGAPAERIMGLLNKGAAVLRSIFENPVAFIRNLFLAVKQGVVGFKNNIGRYLKEGLIAWLTGAISSAGITLPERWDLKGVIHLVLQILGITYQNIRTKLARRLGERNVSRVERAVTLIRQVMTRGPIALWEQIKERLAGLKEQVMEGIRNFIIGQVVRQGVEWIIGMLNPAAGLIKLVSMLYNVVSFFIRNWERIVAFANSVFESVGAIAAGRVGAAARFIEQTLARGVPIIIGFLASLLRLGDMAQKIREIMMRIRRPIDRAIDAVVRRLVRFAKRLLKKLKQRARSAAQSAVQWWKRKFSFTTKSGKGHTLEFQGDKRNARLVIRSKPKNYERFLSDVEREVKKRKSGAAGGASKIEPHLSGARSIYVEIRSSTRKPEGVPPELMEKIGEKTKILKNWMEGDDLNSGGTGYLKKKDVGRGTKKIRDKISNLVGGLPSGGGGFLLGPKFEDGSVRVNGRSETAGKHMRVVLKGTFPVAGGSIPGKGVQQSIYGEGALPVKDSIGGSGYTTREVYVRGHLLNHNLGGTGNKGDNLFPITGYANNPSHLRFENEVKESVKAGYVTFYSVKVVPGSVVPIGYFQAGRRWYGPFYKLDSRLSLVMGRFLFKRGKEGAVDPASLRSEMKRGVVVSSHDSSRFKEKREVKDEINS